MGIFTIVLSDNSLAWFHSYLHRKQYVRLNGRVSQPVNFLHGIPQGSCRGLTLFIFYINENFNEIRNVNIMMFADGCVLYKSGKSWLDIRTALQNGLDKYISWVNEHNLTLKDRQQEAEHESQYLTLFCSYCMHINILCMK